VLTAIRDMFLGQPDGGSLVHRLAIFDAHGDITCIVSQMDVLRCVSFVCVCVGGGGGVKHVRGWAVGGVGDRA
jgi:hypothetical protein